MLVQQEKESNAYEIVEGKNGFVNIEVCNNEVNRLYFQMKSRLIISMNVNVLHLNKSLVSCLRN